MLDCVNILSAVTVVCVITLFDQQHELIVEQCRFHLHACLAVITLLCRLCLNEVHVEYYGCFLPINLEGGLISTQLGLVRA